MGENKALLPLGDSLVIERAITLLRPFFEEVLISGPRADYLFLGHTVVEDLEPEKGPIGGIYSALEHCREDVFVLSCDMPFVSEALIAQLLGTSPKGKISVLRCNGRVYPTLGIYPYGVAGSLKEAIAAGQLKMIRLTGTLKAHYVECGAPYADAQLLNLNTAADLETARSFINATTNDNNNNNNNNNTIKK